MAEPLKGMQGAMRGRGAALNPANRFETRAFEFEGDYLDACVDEEPRPDTRFLTDTTRNIIARNESPDVGFDVSINPYRGCEHGCVYCYARPTHEYLGFSAGLDFETRIMVKEDAPVLLREALRSPRWAPQTLGLSGVTDPYQPVERRMQITRRCLEVLAEFRNPVAIITKNRLVTRDIDLLRQLAEVDAVAVFVSLTTLDLKLNRILEPRTSSPDQRIAAIRQLADAGIPVGTMIAPIIPGLTDNEIAPLLQAAGEAGARFAGYVVLRLPLTVLPLFERWLEDHYPDRRERILNRVRSMRGGQMYKSAFGERMRGEGPYADQIASMFEIARNRANMNGRPKLSVAAFRRPQESGDQLALL